MRFDEIITSPVLFLKGKTKLEVLKEMVHALKEKGVITNEQGFLEDVLKREEISSTAFDNHVATPHAKSKYVVKPTVLVAQSKEGIDFSNGEEVLSKLFFLIAVPEKEVNLHVDILSQIATAISDDSVVNEMINSNDSEKILKSLNVNTKEDTKKGDDYIVAVTACATGIAHTFMARDALVKAANEMGVNIKVETNGADGRQNEITSEDLKKAKGVILAINKSVDESRFNGHQVIQVEAKEGISKAKKLIQDILDNKGTTANYSGGSENKGTSNEKTGVYKHLMSGVSYMLPLVISGGILIALAFLFDSILGYSNAGGSFGSTSQIAKVFMSIGSAAFGLFIPILGGYISYSIANKSGLTAGLVAGALAVSGNSGFLGALAGGLLAGYLAKYLDKKAQKLPNELRGIYMILFQPVLTVLIVGLLMIFLLNPVVGKINISLIEFLNTMSNSSRILLGAILGAMMAVDMGGPVNKAAYLFGTGTLAAATGHGSVAMASVMAGGMVPPLAIAFATTFFKNKYSQEERQAGISNYIMGLSFITEGAIPFAAANPIRVIPGCIIGSAIAGSLTMLFNIAIPAPHGGILVMFLSTNILLYILAVLIGSLIGSIILGIMKK